MNRGKKIKKVGGVAKAKKVNWCDEETQYSSGDLLEMVGWIEIKEKELNTNELDFISQMSDCECRGMTKSQEDWILKIFDRVCNT